MSEFESLLDSLQKDEEDDSIKYRRYDICLTYKREKNERFMNQYLTYIKGNLIVTYSEDIIKEMIDNIDDEKPEELSGELFISIYSADDFVDSILSSIDQEKLNSPKVKNILKMLQAVGMMDISKLGYSISFFSNRLQIEKFIESGDYSKRDATLILKKPINIDFHLKLIPANVLSVDYSQIEIKKFWDTLPKMISNIATDKANGIIIMDLLLGMDASRIFYSGKCYLYRYYGFKSKVSLYE